MNGRKRRVHFVGIGGIGMSGIAEVLLEPRLRRVRLRPRRERHHAPARAPRRRRSTSARTTRVHGHAPTSTCCVISSAVDVRQPRGGARARAEDPRHPARRDARRADAHEVRRRGRAARHGKTTTTSLVGAVLREAGRDPTMVVGGKLRALGTNARLGQGEFLVAEADESDGTFLLLSPIVAVVTNIDREHLDYYGDMERVRDAYLAVHPPRAVLRARRPLPRQRERARAAAAGPQALRHLRHLARRRLAGPRARASTGLETVFEALARRALPRPRSACACPAATTRSTRSRRSRSPTSSDIPFRIAAHALEEFGGIHRRFEVKGEERRRPGGRRLRPPPGGDPRHAARRARGLRAAGSSSPSSRIATRARATCSTSSSRRSTTPTCWC